MRSVLHETSQRVRRGISTPWRITLLYAAAGIVWILFSDWALNRYVPNSDEYLQTVKGVGFVLATMAVLYYLLRNSFDLLRDEVERSAVAERELKQSEDRLNRAQRVARMGSWELDIPNDQLTWSDETYEIFQVDPGKFAGTFEAFFERVHPDDQQRMAEAQRAALAGEQPLDLVHRVVLPGGAIRWVHEIADLGVDAQGRPRRLTGVVRDVSEHERAESALREQQNRLDVLVDAITDYAIMMLDENGLVLSWNRGAENIFGWTASEILGQSFTRFFSQQQLAEGEPRVELEHASLHGRYAVEDWRQRADGSVFRAHVVVTAVHDDDGKLAGFAKIVRDLTTQIHREIALRESEHRLRQAIRVANIGFWDWDVHTNEVYFSPEWKAHIGYNPEELPNQYDEWEKRIHPQDKERVLAAVRNHIADPDTEFRIEFRLEHKDGSYRHILAQGQLDPNPDRPPGRMYGTHLDMTQQRSLEEQFLQAQKMESVGRLAGGVAHDFNNLLSVIIGYAQLTLNALPENSDLRPDIEEIRGAGDRAAALTRQLLAFSRKQVLQPVVVHPDDLIRNLTRMLGRLIGEDVRLQLNLHSGQSRIRIDPSQFEQVLINLAVNARDAMPNGGALVIDTSDVELDESFAGAHQGVRPGLYLLLAVSDNGVGMNAETRRRVFEPFFTTKPHGRGTGLGLATVFGIVHQSDGQIVVYSEPGLGTTFKIYLPLVGDAAQPLRVTHPETTAHGSEAILVAEDDDNLRKLTEKILLQAGYTVLPVGDGANAIELLTDREWTIDILLTDVIMPGISGPDLAERARQLRPGIKVLYMSGYSDEMIAHAGQLNAGTDLLPKPFTAAQLTQRIRDVLGHE